MFWDPQRNLFTIPWINHPVGWYGLLFALGFFAGYFITVRLWMQKLAWSDAAMTSADRRDKAIAMTDALCWFAILGTVLGARLGHVFFYGWPYYSQHPTEIFKIWEGGLASHGGAIGVLVAFALALPLMRRYIPGLSYLELLDLLAIPTMLVTVCIRIGNFINQEIVGVPTSMPWGVVFGHPLDGPAGVPLHPVQLYEAAIYFAVFLFLYRLWAVKGASLRPGRITGWLFVLVFLGRILAECVKTPQGGLMLWDGWIQMGQLLSLPFLMVGVALLVHSRKMDVNGQEST